MIVTLDSSGENITHSSSRPNPRETIRCRRIDRRPKHLRFCYTQADYNVMVRSTEIYYQTRYTYSEAFLRPIKVGEEGLVVHHNANVPPENAQNVHVAISQ